MRAWRFGLACDARAKGTKLVLRGRTFPVAQATPEARFDLRANLQELQAALAAESAALV